MKTRRNNKNILTLSHIFVVEIAVWPDGYIIYSIFGHLKKWKLAIIVFFGQNRLKIVPSNKIQPQKYGQILLQFCQIGEFSHNLVTLVDLRGAKNTSLFVRSVSIKRVDFWFSPFFNKKAIFDAELFNVFSRLKIWFLKAGGQQRRPRRQRRQQRRRQQQQRQQWRRQQRWRQRRRRRMAEVEDKGGEQKVCSWKLLPLLQFGTE